MPVAVEFGGGTVAMKKRVFRSRLNRAIEAELVFQEATAKGIEFSNRQWARLDRIEPQHEANLAELAPHGISWDSLSEGQVDLERRLMEATLLRQNLVAADTGEAPSPDRDAQAAYEAALREMMTHLRSAAEIDISNIDG